MKMRSAILLPICFLLLTSCQTASSVKKPEITVNNTNDGITWNKEDGIKSYEISVNGAEATTITTPEYKFETKAGEYSVSIKAIANDGKASEAVTYTYSTVYTRIDGLDINNTSITWPNLKGTGIEAKNEEGEYVDVVGDSFVYENNGIYSFHAKSGFDAENKVFYVEEKGSKKSYETIVATHKSENVYALESGDEASNYQLNKLYDIKKYEGSSWTTTTAGLALDSSNEGVTDDNCLKLNYWHHGTWFKIEKEIEIDSGYDTLSFYAKGSVYDKTDPNNPENRAYGETYFSISFEIVDDLPLDANNNLQGVYISYMVQPAPTKWTKYTISLDDPNWKIDYGGAKMTFAQVTDLISGLGFRVKSLADMFPFFGAFQIRCNATYIGNVPGVTSGGPSTSMCFDQFTLSNTGEATKLPEEQVAFFKNYAFQSDTCGGKLSQEADGNYLTITKDDVTTKLPVTTSFSADKKLNIVCKENGKDFNAVLVSVDGGNSFALDSVTGTLANDLANMQMERFTIVDDFESYEETGIGYDMAHMDPETRTGLRSAYYCDYYGGDANTSPMGGNGWKLMGTDNYLNLDKKNGRNGGQAGEFKYKSSLDMRYTTYGLSDGTATSIGSGKYLSFWAKGSANRDTYLSVKVFKVNKVTPTNQKEDTPTSYVINPDIVVPKNSDWAEYKVELKEGDVYYGLLIIPLKKYEGNIDYDFFLIDDIAVYNNISPWGL